VPNLAHDGLESILDFLVCLAANVDDLAMKYAVILAMVEVIRIFAGWEDS